MFLTHKQKYLGISAISGFGSSINMVLGKNFIKMMDDYGITILYNGDFQNVFDSLKQ